eukprot:TRINITY_DN2328_c0_g2_i1.p1 TRINITY_DN2328_c0_g2~~TRINITY_DN2328_c0_g2_i1.p1  ORF type:complete len:651 (-),score=127.88 TRINITY_DN2328_c0_g2_i1:342-2294(-)
MANLSMSMTPRSTPRNGPLMSSMTPRSARGGMPFLPGLSTATVPGSNNSKSQSLSYGKGGTGVLGAKSVSLGDKGYATPKLDLSVLQTLSDPFHRYDMDKQVVTHDDKHATKESARNTYCPAIAPAWLKHDRQVLRFYAYFQEPVHENPKETYRIRNCTVYFYLEDATMSIVEPKIENSGFPQGTFVKRHRIPKPRELGGGFYSFHDLKVQVTIRIYSRDFCLVGCDDFTRNFYQDIKEPLLENTEAPLDSFRASAVQESEEIGGISPRIQAIKELKEYNNMALGGNRRNEKLQQYLENDRKVLRFYCYWDDNTKYGARCYYTLHYYLADDSVEMLENIARNAGRDNYPSFWRKAQLSKKHFVTAAPGMSGPEADIYKPEDLFVGGSIFVIGREVVLYDCDDFTREFYRQYMNIEQDSIKIENPPLAHVKLTYPPHSGFGSEDDSLASCIRLTPRPPQRDVKKLMVHGDAVLRFEAIMADGAPEDTNRRFIVAIFLADDTVGVWELKQRNSGHSEGKFASKGKKINPVTGVSFKPTDFYVGAILEINSVPFHLTGADEAAFKHMEERPEEFPHADGKLLAATLVGLKSQIQELAADTEIPMAEFGEMVQKSLGRCLIDHELITLARSFGQYIPQESIAVINATQLLQAMQ